MDNLIRRYLLDAFGRPALGDSEGGEEKLRRTVDD